MTLVSLPAVAHPIVPAVVAVGGLWAPPPSFSFHFLPQNCRAARCDAQEETTARELRVSPSWPRVGQ